MNAPPALQAIGEWRSLACNGIAALGILNMTDTTAIDNVIPRADIVKRAARIGAEIRNVRLSGD